ncbi:MAG: proline dehydrogenase family protein [Thermodesulfobacteriota bacterium]
MKGFLIYLAKRYIAGTKKEHAIEAAKGLNQEGLKATIDILGENVTDGAEAEANVNEYIGLLEEIKASGVDSTISLKLTHLGLDISEELAAENLERILKTARRLNNFVRVDMESSEYTDTTLRIFLGLHERYPNVGVAIQSYLLRSAGDMEILMEKGASVRLVKGAYREPPGVAFQSKSLVNSNFSDMMKVILLKGARPAIATHDSALIDEAVRFAGEKNIPNKKFEFQMLLGISRKLQKRLAGAGFNVRVYVPYGKNWLPYVMRRLVERKENIFFVARHILD